MGDYNIPSNEKYKQKREIVQLTCAQIVKDFQLSAESLSTDGPKDELFPYLVRQMANVLRYLIEQNQTKLMNLLYTIDIGEPQLKKALQQESDESAEVIMAKLIVEREMKKVITRLHFSSNPKDKLLLSVKDA